MKETPESNYVVSSSSLSRLDQKNEQVRFRFVSLFILKTLKPAVSAPFPVVISSDPVKKECEVFDAESVHPNKG